METLPNGEKYQEIQFPKSYTKIVYLANSTINWDTSKNIVFRLFNDSSIHNSSTYRINNWMELSEEKFQYLFYQCDKIIVPNKDFKKLFSEDLHNIIHCYNEISILSKKIRQYFISKQIIHIDKQFRNFLEIKEKEYKEKEPCYFFGLYNEIDFERLIVHKGDKHLIFGGSDLDKTMYHTKVLIPKLINFMKKNKVKIYFISDNLHNRGTELGLEGYRINLDLVGEKWDLLSVNLNSRKNRKNKKNIYCYTGYGKIGKLYNYDLLKKIEGKLPELNFIYSHNLNLPFDKMLNFYNSCCMGIRLTKKDGNANTVIEMGKLGIPVIFNGNNFNAINYMYDDIDDIVIKIKKNLNMSS